MNRYISSLLLLLMAGNALAQKRNNYAWTLGVNGGTTSYYGDLSHKYFNGFGEYLHPQTYFPNYVMGVNLEKRLSSSLGVELDLTGGAFTGNDFQYSLSNKLLTENPNTQRALNFQNKFTQAAVLLSYHADNGFLIPKNARLAPYLSVGVGYMAFRTYADLFYGDTQRYYYWSDNTIRNLAQNDPNANQAVEVERNHIYETRIDNLHTEGKNYATQVWTIPAQLGLNYRISDKWSLNGQLSASYAFSDYLDDVSGKYNSELEGDLVNYAANPSGRDITQFPDRGTPSNWNDMFGAVSLGVKYHFGLRLKKFRGPQFYEIGTKTMPLPITVAPETAVASPTKPDAAIPSSPAPTQMSPESKDSLSFELKKMTAEQVVKEEGYKNKVAALENEVKSLRERKNDTVYVKSEIVASDPALHAEILAMNQKLDSIAKANKISPVTVVNNIGTTPIPNETELKKQDEEIASLEQEMVEMKRKMEKSVLPADTAQYSAMRKERDLLRQENAILKSNPQLKERGDKDKELNEIRNDQALVHKQLSAVQTQIELLNAKQATEGGVDEATIRQLELDKAKLQAKNDVLRNRKIKRLERIAAEESAKPVKAEASPAETQKEVSTKSSTELQIKEAEIAQLKAEIEALKTKKVEKEVPVPTNAQAQVSLPTPQVQPSTSLSDKTKMEQELMQMKLELEKSRVASTPSTQGDNQKLLEKMAQNIEILSQRIKELESRPVTVIQESFQPDPVPAPVVKTELNVGLSKSSIFFGNNSAAIYPADYPLLNAIATELTKDAALKISLKGYASKSGNALANQKISEKRAEAVKAYLLGRGIDASRILIQSFGAVSAYGGELDRRVEVEIVK